MSELKLSRAQSLAFAFAFTLSLLPVLASASTMKSIVKCTPLHVREWPKNAVAEVLEDTAAGKLVMRWETSYYGFTFKSENEVERTAADGIDSFVGDNASLAISLDPVLGEFVATFDSDEDGPQTQRCTYNAPSF